MLTASKGYYKLEDRCGDRETQLPRPEHRNAPQFLLAAGSHQHGLQPCDTPNMEQRESLAPAGIQQGGPFVDRISTEQGSHQSQYQYF